MIFLREELYGEINKEVFFALGEPQAAGNRVDIFEVDSERTFQAEIKSSSAGNISTRFPAVTGFTGKECEKKEKTHCILKRDMLK